MASRSEGRRFKVQEGQERLQGVVATATERELAVRMTEPFPGLVAGVHLPCGAATRVRLVGADERLSPHGWRTAEALLREVYRAGAAFARVTPELRARAAERWQALSAEADAADGLDDEALVVERRRLGLQARRAGLDLESYRRRRRVARLRNAAFHRRHQRLREGIAEDLAARTGARPSVDLLLQLIARAELPVPDCPRCFGPESR